MAFKMPGENTVSKSFAERLERSRQAAEAQEKRKHDIVTFRLAKKDLEGENGKLNDRITFELYLIVSDILHQLEDQRDQNEPKTPEEPWNDDFCDALRLIPETRLLQEELSIAIHER